MNPAPVRPGDVLAGKYRVERVIGTGGIGVVVAARHTSLDQLVALKFLMPGVSAAPQVLERFSREAKAAAKLKSDHVAAVRDVGTLENGAPYIVMEYLEGEDLSQLIRDRPLPVPEAVSYVLQACAAIAEAHSAGIIHRDLKPANLFRTSATDGSPHIKVLDFGIAKITNQDTTGSDHSLTGTRAIMGSPLYMSPEQLESAREVDARADVWALGAILYELVTGRPPFAEESLARLMVAILQTHPEPPSRWAPHIPPALDQVILRCLAKRREDRIASVSELAEALRPFAPAHALDLIRLILGTSRPGHAKSEPNMPLEDAEAPTARAPFGVTPMQESVPTTQRMVQYDSAPAMRPATSASGMLASSQVPVELTADRRSFTPIALGGVGLALLIGLGVVGVVVIGKSRSVATPSAPPTPVASESSALPPPPTPVVAQSESAAPAVSSAPPAASDAPRPKPRGPGRKPTGSGVLSNDRE